MQKGKQTSQIRLPISFRLIELLQTIERFGSRVQRLRCQFSRNRSSFSSKVKQFSRNRSSFSSKVKQWTNWEQRRANRAERRKKKEQEDREIKRAIANRLLKEV